MKTICVGRYLVDVPALADVNLSAEALLARLRLRGADEIADVPGFCNADELLRIAKLRSHKRSINGLDGDEVVGRVREYNRATDYAFDWETRGATDDAPRPDLSLEMPIGVNDRPGGKRVDTDLHEGVLPARWDSIASSFRLRTNELPAAPPE